MGKRKRKSLKVPATIKASSASEETKYIQGEELEKLLRELGREIESAKQSRGGLTEKLWTKKQFSVGVNEVTRTLERMPKVLAGQSSENGSTDKENSSPNSIQLQAVILAADSSPKWLTKHIPILASSRGVPVIFIKDFKAGSLRLGELVKVKTSMAIGIKARQSRINAKICGILRDSGRETHHDLKDAKH